MLGKPVEVEIENSAYGRKARFCAPFFCGRVIDEESPIFGKEVFVITNNPNEEKKISGIVIAILNKDMGKREKFIVAPDDAVFYAPEIRSRVVRAGIKRPFKLNCLYEKSCGAIIFFVKNNQKYFLLVRSTKGKSWGFPKGHIEIGETEEQTAKREVKEETNLDITILRGFKKKSLYHPFGKIRKKVVLFLAKAHGNRVKIQDSEIECYKWVKATDALKSLKHKNDINIFKSAMKWLEKM